MKRLRIFLLLGAFIILASTASAQNILTNGSFEIPVPPRGELLQRYGSNDLVGWTIGPTGSLYIVRGPVFDVFSAIDGSQYVDMNGRGTTLSQAFHTVAGEVYEVTFSVGYFQPTNTSSMQLTALVTSDTGDVLASVTVPAPRERGWANPTRFRFVPTTRTTTLSFIDNTGTVNYDLTLDNVSVERVTPRLAIACSQVRICWESQTNRVYQLQSRRDMSSPWTDFGDPIVGNGTTNCAFEEITEEHRFFRAVRSF